MDGNKITLGDIIKNKAVEKKFSLKTVAEKLEINYKTFIGKMKRDSFTAEELFKIDKVLNLNLKNLKNEIMLRSGDQRKIIHGKQKDSEYTGEINAEIKMYIRARNLSIKHLALKLGIPEKTLYGKLNRNSFSAIDIIEICDALEVDIEKLRNTNINKTTFPYYERMNSDNQRKAKENIEIQLGEYFRDRCNQKEIIKKLMLEYRLEYLMDALTDPNHLVMSREDIVIVYGFMEIEDKLVEKHKKPCKVVKHDSKRGPVFWIYGEILLDVLISKYRLTQFHKLY